MKCWREKKLLFWRAVYVCLCVWLVFFCTMDGLITCSPSLMWWVDDVARPVFHPGAPGLIQTSSAALLFSLTSPCDGCLGPLQRKLTKGPAICSAASSPVGWHHQWGPPFAIHGFFSFLFFCDSRRVFEWIDFSFLDDVPFSVSVLPWRSFPAVYLFIYLFSVLLLLLLAGGGCPWTGLIKSVLFPAPAWSYSTTARERL